MLPLSLSLSLALEIFFDACLFLFNSQIWPLLVRENYLPRSRSARFRFVLGLQRFYASINESLPFLPVPRIPYGPYLANLFLPLKVSALVPFFLSRQSRTVAGNPPFSVRFNLSHSAILFRSRPSCLSSFATFAHE